MPDFFRCSICIPKDSYTQQMADKIQEFEGLSGTHFNPSSTEPNVLEYTHQFVPGGTFDDLENFLVEFGIPFDRFTDSLYEYQPETRKYRPSINGSAEIDKIILEDNDNNSYVYVSDLKDALCLVSNDEIVKKIKELIEEQDPSITPLSEYAGVPEIVYCTQG